MQNKPMFQALDNLSHVARVTGIYLRCKVKNKTCASECHQNNAWLFQLIVHNWCLLLSYLVWGEPEGRNMYQRWICEEMYTTNLMWSSTLKQPQILSRCHFLWNWSAIPDLSCPRPDFWLSESSRPKICKVFLKKEILSWPAIFSS